MLSLSSDCRIFQRLSVPDIVARVCDDLGFRDYRLRLIGSYEPREYCVQYRETHLDFVSRLLEEEGIFYSFEHHADRHVLVLGDSTAMIPPCPGRAALGPAPVAHEVLIDGGDKITLKSGDSSITLEKRGKITIHCKNLEVIGDVEIKASAPKVQVTGGDEAKFGVGNQQMTCDKARVSVSGAAINASAVGTHEITGALVKIN
jgi:hypothetical protein